MTFVAQPADIGRLGSCLRGRGCVDSDTVTRRECRLIHTLPILNGKVALIVRGACGFAQGEPRHAAGATSVVVMNNVPGVVNGTLGAGHYESSPVVGISKRDGDFIIAQATPSNMAWTDRAGTFPTPTGGLISGFSSWGLAADLSLKPDIGAPGGSIRSTYPLEYGSYASISGTSMSVPARGGWCCIAAASQAEDTGRLMSATSCRIQRSRACGVPLRATASSMPRIVRVRAC